MALTTSGNGPIKVGERLPDFSLKMGTKDGVKDFHLKDELGSKELVFGFFPIAFTGTCTKEICEFRDQMGALVGLNAKVFGFSVDTVAANKEFARMHNLTHGIISDPNWEVVPKIWKLATVAGVHNRAARGVMIVGTDGLVKWTGLNENPSEWIGTEEIKKHLTGAKGT